MIKKSQENLTTTILIILLVLASIVIVWKLVDNTLHYDEICNVETELKLNKTMLDENCDCIGVCRVLNKEDWIVENTNDGFNCGSGTECTKYKCRGYEVIPLKE